MGTSAEMRDRLLREARLVRERAYCPYSGYPVGAAIGTRTGRIFAGCNVENASYGLTQCAERVAAASAIAAGEKEWEAICIVTRDGARPCGACRQVLTEFAPELWIIVADASGAVVAESALSALLPESFRGP